MCKRSRSHIQYHISYATDILSERILYVIIFVTWNYFAFCQLLCCFVSLSDKLFIRLNSKDYLGLCECVSVIFISCICVHMRVFLRIYRKSQAIMNYMIWLKTFQFGCHCHLIHQHTIIFMVILNQNGRESEWVTKQCSLVSIRIPIKILKQNT